MKRPNPTSPLIIEMCGANQPLIASLHHGLVETPMHTFYPHLDFNELVVFEAASWDLRNKSPGELSFYLAENSDIYSLFSKVNTRGFPWLNRYKEVSEQNQSKYDKLNPFHGRDLRDRLEKVMKENPEKVSLLKKRLSKPTNTYVFECQRDEAVMKKRSNEGIEVMTFQNFYPTPGKIVPAFASEIARIMKTYPTEY